MPDLHGRRCKRGKRKPDTSFQSQSGQIGLPEEFQGIGLYGKAVIIPGAGYPISCKIRRRRFRIKLVADHENTSWLFTELTFYSLNYIILQNYYFVKNLF